MNSGPQDVPGECVVQSLEGPHVDPVCRPKRPATTVDKDSPHHARKRSDRTQPWQHASVIAWLELDLDRLKLIALPEQEIHLCPASGLRRPVAQVPEQSPFLPVDPQQMQDPAFKERTTFFGRNWTVDFLHRPHQARICPVELWMMAFAHPQPRLEGGQAESNQGVFKDVQIALNGGPCDTAVTCKA